MGKSQIQKNPDPQKNLNSIKKNHGKISNYKKKSGSVIIPKVDEKIQGKHLKFQNIRICKKRNLFKVEHYLLMKPSMPNPEFLSTEK